MSAKRIEVHHGAREDYLETLSWDLDRSVLVAERFQSELTATFAWLAVSAEIPAADKKGIHWKRMDRFPHVVYYRIKNSESVEVLAIAHGRQRPGFWKTRLE